MNKLISTIEDVENGIKVVLGENNRGFTVQIVDVDSGETLPTMKIFKTLEAAREYAISCTNA